MTATDPAGRAGERVAPSRAPTTDPAATSRLRSALRRRRDRRARVDTAARAQLAADERDAAARPARTRPGLADAWRAFWAHPSPWLIGAVLLLAAVLRIALGGGRWWELAIPAVMLASFPAVEWLVHVFILHRKPTRLGSRTIDPLLSRAHRAHHADPRDLPLVFIPWPVLLWLLPLNAGAALLALPDLRAALTYLVALAAIGMGYEWTHYLIHSDYPPRSTAYKALWRNHRLHHYKNEHYWFTVTTAGTVDRLLGTYPDPAAVPTSPTARDLLGTPPR